MVARTHRAALAVVSILVLVVPAAPAGAAAPTGPYVTGSPAVAERRSMIQHESELYRAPGVTPEAVRRMQRQDALLRVAERIRAKAPTTGSNGLSGLVVDPDRDAVQLYWRGSIPKAESEIVSAARAEGVTVSVEQAPYTERQLLSEIDRMAKANASAADGSRFDLQLAPQPDGSGIWVGAGSSMATADLRRSAPALDTDIPLQVERSGRFDFSFRWYDFAPWWGGSYIEYTRGGFIHQCSDAFGVTGNNGAATYLLSAAHCGQETYLSGTVQLPDTGGNFQLTYGSTISAGWDAQHDAQLILTPQGADAGVYWGASINPPSSLGSNSGIAVSGTENNVVGAYVCNSGSFSGTVCNIQIQLAKVTFSFAQPVNGVQNMNHMSLGVKQPDSSGVTEANGEGDSGGPIISVVNNKARAYGVISGMYTGGGWDAPCTGYVPPDRNCSRSVWFGDIRTILSTVGAQMNTG